VDIDDGNVIGAKGIDVVVVVVEVEDDDIELAPELNGGDDVEDVEVEEVDVGATVAADCFACVTTACGAAFAIIPLQYVTNWETSL